MAPVKYFDKLRHEKFNSSKGPLNWWGAYFDTTS